MRSMFESNPHGRYDMSRFAAPAFAKPVKMGCDIVDVYAEEDHVEEVDPYTLACKKCAKKHRRTSGRMGSAKMGDDFFDTAKSIFDTTLGAFADVIKYVPPAAAGVYKDRLKGCQDMVGANPNTGTYLAAGKCLRDLYKDIQDGKGAGAPATIPPPVAQPSTFPIIPVALAAVAGLGVIYYLTTMKK